MSETGEGLALVTYFISFSESCVTIETENVSKMPETCQHSTEVALSL